MNFFTAIIVGSAGSILTTFLTPRFQHHFWSHQRLKDERLDVAKEFNSFTAEFIYNPQYGETPQFFKSYSVLTANIKTLFSHKAFDCFKEFDVELEAIREGKKGHFESFLKARDKTLRVLYEEAIGTKSW